MDYLEFAATYTLEGDTLSGVVHAFGERTLRDGIWHEFDAGAFGKSKPLAFYSHDQSKPLERTAIEVNDGKLLYSMQLGHQSYAEDLRENVAAGLMDKMSFGVYPRKWKDTRGEDGRTVRLHTASDLFDISPVALPAFAGTAAMLHSANDDRRALAAMARYRVLEGMTHGWSEHPHHPPSALGWRGAWQSWSEEDSRADLVGDAGRAGCRRFRRGEV